MPENALSFDEIKKALNLAFEASEEECRLEFDDNRQLLLMRAGRDLAGFTQLNGTAEATYKTAYAAFRHTYRERHEEWDKYELSFVICRLSKNEMDNEFFAALETDPVFCRKYVLDVSKGSDAIGPELFRLPFIPMLHRTTAAQRPRPAVDLLSSSGVPISLANKIQKYGAQRLADDILAGRENVPKHLIKAGDGAREPATARAITQIKSLSMERFRAYRTKQTFDLDASVIVLFGANGVGKTSVFDAIDYACTGRIGRLCRTTRSQSDFKRFATHLDSPPGQGNVTLDARTLADGGSDDWTISRTTGDWTDAWIGDVAQNRKGVLDRFTSAQWADGPPRVESYEKLFRATHLFGQDDQELLLQFKKTSIIPEALISKMLALQDYSSAIGKSNEVGKFLASALDKQDVEIRQFDELVQATEDEIGSLRANIRGDKAPGVLTELSAEIATELGDLGVMSKVDATQNPEELTDLVELLDEQSRQSERRLLAAERLLPNIQQYLADQRTSADLTTASQKLQAETSRIRADLEEKRKVDLAAAQKHAELSGQLKTTREKKAEFLIGKEQFAKAKSLQSEIGQLTEEVVLLEATKAAVSERIREATESLNTAESTATESRNKIMSAQDVDRQLEAIAKRIPEFEVNRKRLAQIVADRESCVTLLGQSAANRQKVQQEIRESKGVLTRARSEYDALSRNSAELDKLLDAVLQYVEHDNCPLCGTDFDSIDELKSSISGQRDVQSAALIAANNNVDSASTALRSAEAQLAEFQAEIQALTDQRSELDRTQKELVSAIADFRTRTESISSLGGEDCSVQKVLSVRKQNAVVVSSLEGATRSATENRNAASNRLKELETEMGLLTKKLTAGQLEISTLKGKLASIESDAYGRLDGLLNADELEGEIAKVDSLTDRLKNSFDEAETEKEMAGKLVIQVERELQESELASEVLVEKIRRATANISSTVQILTELPLKHDLAEHDLNTFILATRAESIRRRRTVERLRTLQSAFRAREAHRSVEKKEAELNKYRQRQAQARARKTEIQEAKEALRAINALLSAEREKAVKSHIAAYGPLITIIQQRLRSVYGFGKVELDTNEGDVTVRVDWRDQDIRVHPSDFFSDAQKQILMLSIFFAGAIRQNWSGFSPILLDDPVTHFDDLNAHGFVEMVRGFVSSSPNRWQFVISTCEERLYSLMRRKFANVPGDARFYRFSGMSEEGPIVQLE